MQHCFRGHNYAKSQDLIPYYCLLWGQNYSNVNLYLIPFSKAIKEDKIMRTRQLPVLSRFSVIFTGTVFFRNYFPNHLKKDKKYAVTSKYCIFQAAIHHSKHKNVPFIDMLNIFVPFFGILVQKKRGNKPSLIHSFTFDNVLIGLFSESENNRMNLISFLFYGIIN